jgi:outer membrane protein OmpA-like peptidoglycan-associated protein
LKKFLTQQGLFICFLCLVPLFGFSQNLVANHSFEDENICEFNDNCNPSAWFDISGSPHGYRLDNSAGATGRRWINVIVGYQKREMRQYWQTLLMQPLVKGKKYKISMSVQGYLENPYPKDIGILFTDSMMLAPLNTILQPADYLVFTDAKFRELKNGWFKMEKEFVATDNHRAIVLGNFSDEDYVEIAKHRYTNTRFVSVKVDNVEIIPVEKISCDGCIALKDSLYAITRRHYPQPEVDITDTIQLVQTLVVSEKIADSIELGDVLFNFGSHTISDSSALAKFATTFSATTLTKIEIYGYTDDVGDAEANLLLSEKRAREVSKMISSMFNVSPILILSKGKGVSKKYKEQHRNRRVDVLIYH